MGNLPEGHAFEGFSIESTGVINVYCRCNWVNTVTTKLHHAVNAWGVHIIEMTETNA